MIVGAGNLRVQEGLGATYADNADAIAAAAVSAGPLHEPRPTTSEPSRYSYPPPPMRQTKHNRAL